jgi:hypothetical protein
LKAVENSSEMKSERTKWLGGKVPMWLTAAAVCDSSADATASVGGAPQGALAACAERSTRTRDPGWGAICCAKRIFFGGSQRWRYHSASAYHKWGEAAAAYAAVVVIHCAVRLSRVIAIGERARGFFFIF